MSLENPKNKEPKISNPEDNLKQSPHHLSEEELEKLSERFEIKNNKNEKPKDFLKINFLLEKLSSKDGTKTQKKAQSENQKEIKIENKHSTITNAVDFIPIIGSAKMVLEAIKGKQYGTEKEISGKLRLLHGGSGALFFVLDITGVGAILSELGKAGIKLSLRNIEKRTIGKVIGNESIKKETAKLIKRGDKRNENSDRLTEKQSYN